MSSIKYKIWEESYIKKVIELNRLAHAYLFLGPDQQKKIWTAMAMAKALLCSKEGAQFCDSCPACKRVESHNHPDVIWVRPTGAMREIKVDVARALQASLSLKSFEGGMKLAFLIDADRMNMEAANALLKTIEEPTPNTVMVFIANDIENFLPTIVSRCQQIYFPLSSREQLQEYLATEHRLDDKHARFISSISQGNFSLASRYLDDDRRIWRDFIINSVEQLLKGTVDIFMLAEETEIKIMERVKCSLKNQTLIASEMGVSAENADEITDDKAVEKSIINEEIYEYFQQLELFCRDLLLYIETSNPEFIINSDKLSSIHSASDTLDKKVLHQIIYEIGKAYEASQGNIKLQFVLEILFDKIAGEVAAVSPKRC